MTQPTFWKTKNIVSLLLWPLSLIYQILTKIRWATTTPYKAKIPVICIGNISVGGTGKTPVVIALTQYFKKKGKKVHILSRGYKGRLNNTQVNPKKHTSQDVGDEPLLLAKIAPTWIFQDRAQGARNIEKTKADIILMDDGFQNPQLHKDMSIIVEGPIGNNLTLPAGPLRETQKSAFKRADIIIQLDHQKHFTTNQTRLKGSIIPKPHKLKNKLIIAFAGIGHPEKFFKTLKQEGAIMAQEYPFPDHHAYTEKELKKLEQHAKKIKATLVTTEKDWIRLTPAWQKKIETLAIDVKWQNSKDLDKLFKKFT